MLEVYYTLFEEVCISNTLTLTQKLKLLKMIRNAIDNY